MSYWHLILRGAAFHRRANLGAILAAAIGTAVLVGALLVGDSVRGSLRAQALERVGEFQFALVGGDRFFTASLAERLMQSPVGKAAGLRADAVLLVPAVCDNDDTKRRANQVQIFGVGKTFTRDEAAAPKKGEAILSARLAEALGAMVGAKLRIRIYKPGLLPHDAPMGSDDAPSALLRVTVSAILPDRGIGRFDLNANQIPPLNLFLPIADLQEKLEQKDRANLLLMSGRDEFAASSPEIVVEKLVTPLWNFDDAQWTPRIEKDLNFQEVATPRVFFEDSVADKLIKGGAQGLVTYFVNTIRHGTRETPYSMVTAAGAPLVDASLKDDEILLNAWTAEDLAAKPGDTIELEYFTVGLLRKLETKKASFKLKGILPIEGLHADRKLMPEFPGMADVDTTHDWDSGIPIDMKRIRDKDEDYWKKHRGTPKAFISLKKGIELWQNRFGTYTAFRFPTSAHIDQIAREAARPDALGVPLLPIKKMALLAVEQSMDFGMLFLGLSFFLIAAALLLMALIFLFNVESRARETGLLLAVGLPPRAVRWIAWGEGTLFAAIGSLIGLGGGIVYARWLLDLLATRWRGAVGSAMLQYHAEPRSLVIGAVAGTVMASLAILWAVRKQTSRPARELLASSESVSSNPAAVKRWRWTLAGSVLLIVAVAVVALAGQQGGLAAAGIFFGAGGVMLMAMLCFARAVLVDSNRESRAFERGCRFCALTALGLRAAARRGGRSLATVALLACGSFLVVAVGVNQQDASIGAADKASGTGGFALLARSAIPLIEDLNTEAGRSAMGVRDEAVAGATIFPMRVKAGDDASCLNLNRAQKPRILGVPMSFIERGGFTFVQGRANGGDNPWRMLLKEADGAIPAICDEQSLTWALGLKVGDTLSVTDESGAPRTIRFVGTIANSILQGSVLIAEAAFLRLFPSISGYQSFLIDAPPASAKETGERLQNALLDEGFETEPAKGRLAALNQVQNTYLATFQALGGLGVLLGSLGLGVVVLRNVLERRAELAVMRAVGFSRTAIGWMVLSEHLWLLVLGLGAGVISALVAVLPTLRISTLPFPWELVGAVLAGILACGLFAAILATAWSVRGAIIPALRND